MHEGMQSDAPELGADLRARKEEEEGGQFSSSLPPSRLRTPVPDTAARLPACSVEQTVDRQRVLGPGRRMRPLPTPSLFLDEAQ